MPGRVRIVTARRTGGGVHPAYTRRMERPGVMRWLWYAMGGGLPTRNRDWVLHDLTTRWWWVRSLVRSTLQILPAGLLVMAFLPSELWVRLMAVTCGASVGLIYAIAYLDEVTEHRALKAGFAPGTVKGVRDKANSVSLEAEAARYAQRYRTPTPPDSE